MAVREDVEALAKEAVDCGYRIHRDLGPGLLESAYEALMAQSLFRRGLHVDRQLSLPLEYDGVVVDNAFKIDLLVEGKLVIG